MNSDPRTHRGVCAAFALLAFSAHADEREAQWRTVADLTADEQALIDPRSDTPRDGEYPYVPAEPYPFSAPYTAEEMAYRMSEFVHIVRWPMAMVDVYGVITSSGYINQGVSISLTAPVAGDGMEGYIRGVKPGQVYSQWLTYDLFPPESEGGQQLWLPNRTDLEHRTKMDYYIYSPQLRRVRRQPQPRRDQRFPDSSQTFDDVIGRDPWEFRWELIGTDVLYETVRFPSTRPSITVHRHGQGLVEQSTAAIKMMGESYPHYRADGGVECWVVKATPRAEWLPDYSEKKLIFWLDKHYFYPLRMEKYGADGKLMMIEARYSERENPARGEFGYTALTTVYWNVEHDLVSYSVHDGTRVGSWTPEEKKMMFTPEFMRRQWLIEPITTQALIRDPEHFYLRAKLHPGKFPGERDTSLPPAIQARYDAQEAAGRLVFESAPVTVVNAD